MLKLSRGAQGLLPLTTIQSTARPMFDPRANCTESRRASHPRAL